MCGGRGGRRRGREGLHDTMHLVVNDMPGSSEINWVNHLVIPVVLIAIQILGLATMTYSRIPISQSIP